jgi:hypothetical protein
MEKPVFLLREVREYDYLEDMKKVFYHKFSSYYNEFNFTMQDFFDKCPKDIPLDKIIVDIDCSANLLRIYSEEKVPARPEQYVKGKKDYDEKYNQYLEEMIKYNAWKKENDKAQKIKYHEEELTKLKQF